MGARGVGGAELQRVQQLDQALAVMIGVGRLEHPLLVLTVARSLGPVLLQQGGQRLRPARHSRVDHLADQAVRTTQCRLGHLEQDVLLARDPFQLGDELVHHPGLRAGVDPVHRGDQQVHERVSDLPLPAVQQGGQQRELDGVLVLTQVAGSLHGGSRPPRSEHLRGDIGEQPRGQPDMTEQGQLGGLFLTRLQAHIAGIRLDEGERLPAIPVPAGVIAGLRDQRQHPGRGRGRDAGGDPQRQGRVRLVQRRADDPADPVRGRRLDQLIAAVPEELLAHPLRMTFPVAGMLSQPGGELPGVGDRAFPEPEERADLGTVVLERPA
jgi:hypothetical protein